MRQLRFNRSTVMLLILATLALVILGVRPPSGDPVAAAPALSGTPPASSTPEGSTTPDPPETVESTPSPTATATLTPEATLTATPEATATPESSQTPTPTPQAYFTYLPGLQVAPTAVAGCAPRPHIPAYSLAEERAISTLINDFRLANGRPALHPISQLVQASRRHALDSAANGLISHQGSDGSSVGDRVTDACYHWVGVGEILGHLPSAEIMAEGWFNSANNRALILSEEYTDFGAAYYYDPASNLGHYWVVTFARPFSAGFP